MVVVCCPPPRDVFFLAGSIDTSLVSLFPNPVLFFSLSFFSFFVCVFYFFLFFFVFFFCFFLFFFVFIVFCFFFLFFVVFCCFLLFFVCFNPGLRERYAQHPFAYAVLLQTEARGQRFFLKE